MNSFLLSLSITLLLVPLIFHIFHELPLLSLFYNTFFTPIFALHIALLLLSCLFPFLFPLYTKISKIFFYPIFHPPHLLHIILRAPPFSLNTCILIEGFLVLLTFSLWNYKKNTVAKYKKIYHNHFRLRR